MRRTRRPDRPPRRRPARTRAAFAAAGRGVWRVVRAVAEYALSLLGVGLAAAAGFSVHRALGLAVLAAAVFLLERDIMARRNGAP